MIPAPGRPGYFCCPYNREHMMPKESMHWHFARCQAKKARAHEFSSCQFNALHILLKPELSAHEAKCPDKKKVGVVEKDVVDSDLRSMMSAWVESQATGEKPPTRPIPTNPAPTATPPSTPTDPNTPVTYIPPTEILNPADTGPTWELEEEISYNPDRVMYPQQWVSKSARRNASRRQNKQRVKAQERATLISETSTAIQPPLSDDDWARMMEEEQENDVYRDQNRRYFEQQGNNNGNNGGYDYEDEEEEEASGATEEPLVDLRKVAREQELRTRIELQQRQQKQIQDQIQKQTEMQLQQQELMKRQQEQKQQQMQYQQQQQQSYAQTLSSEEYWKNKMMEQTRKYEAEIAKLNQQLQEQKLTAGPPAATTTTTKTVSNGKTQEDSAVAEVRKLKKKLRQIEALEEKKAKGVTLDESQEGKIRLKGQLEDQIKRLQEKINV